MSPADVRALIQFWKPPQDRRLSGEAAERRLGEIRTQVIEMDREARGRFAEIAKEQFDEQDRIRADVAGRASQLLLFVGIVLTGTTIVAGSFSSSLLLVTALTLIVGLALLYACLAIAWLAVQAQRVRDWSRPGITPSDVTTVVGLDIENAARTYFGAAQNKLAADDLVAHLRDAQWWARTAIVLVAILAVLAVAASATKRPEENATCICAPSSSIPPSPAASASPLIAPSPSRGPTPSPRLPFPSTSAASSAPGPTQPSSTP
ncbi:MAG: hypothetical protein FIA92_01300 [Chloroflexi bacterium]|nr:hypothetical protein [Chloroflexota bacterium]